MDSLPSPRRLPRRSWIAALLVLVLAGCRPDPCVTCQIWRMKGRPIEAFLATGAKPDKVLEEPGGGRTWLFTYGTEDRIPVPPDPALHSSTAVIHERGFLGVLGVLLEGLLGGGPREAARPIPRDVMIVATLLAVRTGPAGTILSSECRRVTLQAHSVRVD